MKTVHNNAPSTVLLIDDDVLERTPLSAYLRDCGYTVYEAADGDEALVVLKAPGLHFAIVFCKAEVAGSVDGFGLKRWVQQTHPALPVLLFGSPGGAAAAAGELCEQGPMLAKPYEHKIVETRIRQLLATRDRGCL